MSLDEFFAAQRWIPFVNSGSTTIPPHGVCIVAGCYFNGTLQIERCTAPSRIGLIVINGSLEVAQNKNGMCTRDWPALVYAPGLTTGRCGTQTNSFALASTEIGFWSLGSPVDDYILANLHW